MENKLGSAAEGGTGGPYWDGLFSLRLSPGQSMYSIVSSEPCRWVRAVLFWALPKAAWRATSSNLEGNTKFLGADEEISSDHWRRDAAAPVRGTGGQRSLCSKGKQRKWDVFFSKGKLQRENQLWPFATPRDSGATQPSENVPPPYFASLPEEVTSKERAETDLCWQALATNKSLSWQRGRRSSTFEWRLKKGLIDIEAWTYCSLNWHCLCLTVRTDCYLKSEQKNHWACLVFSQWQQKSILEWKSLK